MPTADEMGGKESYQKCLSEWMPRGDSTVAFILVVNVQCLCARAMLVSASDLFHCIHGIFVIFIRMIVIVSAYLLLEWRAEH